VYDAIPTIVTTFVAIIAKISILIFLLDLISYTASIIAGDLPKDNLLLDSKDKQNFS
jgi:NADH:ubiquinone oxidoreductase subunit 2 (subunit N)